MRYMLIFKADKDGVPACKDLAEMGTLMDELKQSGVLLGTEGLQPTSSGARVRLAGGKFTTTDGPFAEAKELIAGFALVRVNSKDEAVELSKRFLRVAGEGASEIREVIESPAPR